MLSQSSEYDGSHINQLAQSLEQLLFKTAPSFREYADTKTLKSRIRLLTVSLLRRRMRKRQLQTRAEALRATLGVERLAEASTLVHTVKQLRLARTSRGCRQCESEDDALCTSREENISPFAAQEQLPSPVRSLFFETALVDAFDSAPAERMPHLDWETMIDQARCNIHRYSSWCEESGR